jgi:predicted RNA-binding Zn-ribbon protein involved in translation (DUF1610 family)
VGCPEHYTDDQLDELLPRTTNAFRRLNARLVQQAAVSSAGFGGPPPSCPDAAMTTTGDDRARTAADVRTALRAATNAGERTRCCPQCGNFVVHSDCGDLTGHGENHCNNCGFYSPHASDWPEWDGSMDDDAYGTLVCMP